MVSSSSEINIKKKTVSNEAQAAVLGWVVSSLNVICKYKE